MANVGRPTSFIGTHSAGLKATDAEWYYREVEQFGLTYGSNFRAIHELWSGYGEAFAHIDLPTQLLPGVEQYQIHPVLLDACLQVQGAALLASQTEPASSGIFLPVGIERIGPVPRPVTKLWAHCRLRPAKAKEQIVGDIQVFDDSGTLLTQMEGLAVRRTSREVLQLLMKGHPAKTFCQIEWRPQTRLQDGKPHAVAESGSWLVFADSTGIGSQVAGLLNARGEECIMVYPRETLETSDTGCWWMNPSEPKHFEEAFQRVRRLRRVLYLWSAEPATCEEPDLSSLRQAQVLGCEGLLHLVQALAKSGATASRSLWVATCGTQAIDGTLRSLNPAQTPIWGLGRTLAQEHSELWGGMIDLEFDGAASSQAELLLEEMWHPEEEDHLAFRGGRRYVARLVEKKIRSGAPPLQLKNDCTYMITGGLGGLGLTVARWMVARDARHLLLVGRRTVHPDVSKMLAELEEAGAQASYYQADISQEEEVARLLTHIDENLPPLRGIIHAAGVVADGTILQQSWPRFLQVMAPKIDGSWHLHSLTKHLPLDHFVLFSSSASLLGAAGQGNYAAANAFMDGLSHFRRSRGLPALSINWGPWAEVGMSAGLDPRAAAQRAAQGIRLVLPAEGVRLLEQAMSESWPEVGIVSVDWETLFKVASPVFRRSSLFKELALAATGARAETRQEPSAVIGEFLSAAAEERRHLVQSYVAERVADVLRSEPASLDLEEPLTLQGFDSLMALELRDRVEAELQVSVPILNLFRDNTITAFTTFLLAELAKKDPGALPEVVQEKSPRELLARLNELSDAEVDAALRRELEA